MTEQYAIECRQITKVFGSVVANDKIDLTVRYGEIMALLGENGSGKTTLMNMLSGIYHPDAGSILVGGKEVSINSPVDSRNLGIGMIHQHFKLVEVFSAMDNIVLGTKGKRLGRKALREKIEALGQSFGLEIEPEKKVYDMSVSDFNCFERHSSPRSGRSRKSRCRRIYLTLLCHVLLFRCLLQNARCISLARCF